MKTFSSKSNNKSATGKGGGSSMVMPVLLMAGVAVGVYFLMNSEFASGFKKIKAVKHGDVTVPEKPLLVTNQNTGKVEKVSSFIGIV
jgi:hypothetical protein